MKYLLGFVFLFITTISHAQTWVDVAVIEGRDIYVDTLKIEHKETQTIVWVKEVYTSPEAKTTYLAKMERALSQTPSGKKSWEKKWKKKWENVSYSISKRVYDCINSQSRTLEVTDYDSNDKKIQKIKSNEKNAKWVPISADSVGDFMQYYICDTMKQP